MINTALILFILLQTKALAQIPAISTFNEDDMVQCFNDVTSCNANSNVMMITAGQCCNSTGGSSRHVKVVFLGNQAFCSNCFVVTFSQRSYMFGPDKSGETVSFPIIVSYFSGTGSYNTILMINNNPALSELPNSGLFIYRFSSAVLQLTSTTLIQNFTMTLASGNQIALEDGLSFDIELSVCYSSFNDLTVIVLSSAHIIIDDLDTISIKFDEASLLYEAQESSGHVSVLVSRDTISFATSFNVTITTREYSGDPSTLSQDQSIAVHNIDYIDGETVTNTFIAESTDTEKTFEFTIINDKIVEVDELFDLVITVSDSRVKIEREVGYASISDDEKFSIGFNQTEYTIYEGENITLTVIEYQGLTGGILRGGVPEPRLLGSFLVFFDIDSSADENVDFTINKTLPLFSYSPNNTINSISVPFHSLSDSVLERFETVVLEIRLDTTDLFIQTHNNIVRRVTITILDNTMATVKLSASKYNTSEPARGVHVCAKLINATLGSGQSLRINFAFIDGSALRNEDYFRFLFLPTYFNFIAPNTQACITITIVNDNIKEPLFEFFNITLLHYDPNTSPTPGYTGLTVDTIPSSICIEDDDQAEVRFERSNVTFSEADGNQYIYVILDGGQISNNQTVEVYDIRTNQTVGIVTFVDGVAPPQRQPVVFPVVDNNIAHEFDILTQLGLRNYGQLQEGIPFTMNVTVVDDDV